jgi:hypothetical protein
MDTTITTEPAGKRARNGSVILTDRMCEKRVAKRVKFYDRKCSGLYVSITTAGVATFSFKFTDPATGKQRPGWLGFYNPETFTVEDARSKVYGLRAVGGDAAAETFRDRKVRQAAGHDGPTMFARIGVMRALNRHVERVFNSDRKVLRRHRSSRRGRSRGRHFGNCPVSGAYLNMRNLGQLLVHVHDQEIEISEGPEPARQGPLHLI